jgi:hypothetical protein
MDGLKKSVIKNDCGYRKREIIALQILKTNWIANPKNEDKKETKISGE